MKNLKGIHEFCDQCGSVYEVTVQKTPNAIYGRSDLLMNSNKVESRQLLQSGQLPAIKEPRFMKNTNHLSPISLYRQMCIDQKQVCKNISEIRLNMSISSSGSEDNDPTTPDDSTILSQEDRHLIQGIRETAVIKILENGVRLGLKLQTSHISSMYFETWLDRKRKSGFDPVAGGKQYGSWLDQMMSMKEKDLRSYLDLVTLSCTMLASKVNE